jgi:8-oxo-dGTP diphosphatase
MAGLRAGKDYVGVGVGAVVVNDTGQVFLSQRGEKATNERGTWEFPGGKVDFGETLQTTLKREFMEEYGMTIQIIELLSVDDHILEDEGQHWVSPTYIAHSIGDEPQILEPDKCRAIGWFDIDNLPAPLSLITQYNVRDYRQKLQDT